MLTRLDDGKHQVSLHCSTHNIWSISIYCGSDMLWLGQALSVPGIYALFRERLSDVVKIVGGALAFQMLGALEALDYDYADSMFGYEIDREVDSFLTRVKSRRFQ